MYVYSSDIRTTSHSLVNKLISCLIYVYIFSKTVIFKFSLGFLRPDLAEPTGFASFRFVCKLWFVDEFWVFRQVLMTLVCYGLFSGA